jgi:predicted dehydrogenase
MIRRYRPTMFSNPKGSTMRPISRRTILEGSALGAAALTLAGARPKASAQERVTAGLIGSGGMGSNHLRMLAARQDMDLAFICDVDGDRLAEGESIARKVSGKAPKGVKDLRHVLDDRTVDAVWIATPDHWHAPAAILALDAGKHVYVEKPCCHNIREGRLMAEAVKRSGKILQVGTQSRSTAVVEDAIARVKGGAIGDVLVAKAWNSQRRRSIGKSQPSQPPRQLDFDLWVGPAPMVPYRSNMLPGIWRWWHAFGCGDIGNDGVHDIDVACWGLGVASHPSRIACLGGKSFFDDDQQFPDTQYAVFEYPDAAGPGRPKQLIFEQRIWSPYVQEGYENGAAFYGTEGMLVIGHSIGWTLYGPNNKKIAERTGPADVAAHHQNFLDCIRETTVPNANITVGHRSATLVHLANIGARVGRILHFDPQAETIADDSEAVGLLSRQYRDGHWAAPRSS